MNLYMPAAFDLPSGLSYFNGNSLGPLTKRAKARVGEVTAQEWGAHLIRAWNTCDWMSMPARLGDRLAHLIGAGESTVMVGDTLTLKVYQALDAALAIAPNGRTVLSDTGNFPTDLYAAKQVADALILVEPEAIMDRLSKDIGVLLLTHVDYRTARVHDMKQITRAAQDRGIICIWDLAHSAGTLSLDIDQSRAEFAIGCTYKYLNGGPGAPAFIYARPDLIADINPRLVGWMGHATPFDFDLSYACGQGRERWRIGTPPVLQMAALDGALDLWDQMDLDQLETEARALGDHFIAGMDALCPGLSLVSPRLSQARGGHVSYAFDQGYALMQALIQDHQIIGDFRAPDRLRFGFSPLYNSKKQIDHLVETIASLLKTKAYEKPEYALKSRVT